MIAPTAPAAAAFACLAAKVQPPRLIRAILPLKASVAKSVGSQPLEPSASTGAATRAAVVPPTGVDLVYVIARMETSRDAGETTESFSACVSV